MIFIDGSALQSSSENGKTIKGVRMSRRTIAPNGLTSSSISAKSQWRLTFAIVLVAALPHLCGAQTVAPGSTQSAKISHWGPTVSVTPSWTANDQWRSLLLSEGNLPMEGSEFTVGIVRGSSGGGDWGVSYVRKRFKDGLVNNESDSSCSGNFCSSSAQSETLHSVELTGVEVHWFWAIANIKNRVQLGLNIAGGVASVKGEVEEFRQFSFSGPQLPQQGQTDHEFVPANEVFYKTQPLAKLEAVAAVVLVPGLKFKVGGGYNAPGPAFRVAMVYLIGAK